MVKKMFVLALAVMAFVSQADAQKLDKNSLSFIKLSGYPLCPIPMKYTSYALVDENNNNLTGPVTQGFFANSGRLSKTLVSNGADITIRYSGITDYTAPIELVKEEDVYSFLVKKGRRPQKVRVIGGRFQAFGYKTCGFFVDVTTDDGVVYSDSLFSFKEYESPLFHSRRRAEMYIDSLYKKDAALNDLFAYNIKNESEKFNRIVCQNIGFTNLDNYRFHVYSVKTNKKSEFDYKDLEKAAEVFEKAAKIIDKNDYDTTAFKQMAEPCLKTWLNALSADDKRLNREIVAAIFYNIGNYYVFMKDFEKASGFYSQSAAAKTDFADTERLIKNTKAWAKAKERYEAMMRESATVIMD